MARTMKIPLPPPPDDVTVVPPETTCIGAGASSTGGGVGGGGGDGGACGSFGASMPIWVDGRLAGGGGSDDRSAGRFVGTGGPQPGWMLDGGWPAPISAAICWRAAAITLSTTRAVAWAQIASASPYSEPG